jgi:diguanylate cyclase (GGDEF)-like protein
LKAGGPPPKQLVESRTFREKFRNILQNTRLQRENVHLILFRIQNMGELEEHVGGEMLLRILKHIIATFCGILRKNDLLTRLDRDVMAVLLINVTPAGAKDMAGRLQAAIQNMRFRYQDRPYRVIGHLGIASCRMHDTMETIVRKALLAIDMAPAPDQPAIVTDAEIPPDLLDTIYSM